jgi:arylsulfatase A-like enzyme/Tfp pilus assembly protein PilF
MWMMVLALAACLGTRARGGPPERLPDVVLVTIDTLRADHLGCYGYKQAQTANLDAFAASADRFAHAYTPVPITLPAHTVILTGSYPMATGMHDFSGNRLPADATTLATLLHQSGYRTAAFVSAAVLDSRFGLNAGFDTYYDHFDFSRLDETNLDLMERRGDQTTDAALAWLRDQSGEASTGAAKPLFLWLHLYDPHYPYTPPEPYATQYRDRPYDGEIAFADAQVGRLFSFLKDKGIFENSVLVVTGDHGEGLGEHGEKTHGFFIYNSTLHVPLIIKVPGVSARVIEGNASLIDIAPTVLEALRIAVPATVQGRSRLGEMQSRPSGDPARELYAETFLPLLHFHWSNLRSIQEQGLKYIDAPRPELYDTRADPGELNNLATSRPAVAHELHARLVSLIGQDSPGSGAPAQAVPTDPILLARLRSLGYVALGSTYADPKGKPLPDPKDRIQVYELFSEAMSDGQHGHYRESLQKLDEAEKADPRSLPIQYLMALDYYRLKDFSNAAARFQSAIQLDPKFALATYYLGLSQAQMGALDAARLSFQHALELDPTNFEADFDLGALLLKMNRVDDALAQFEKAVEVNPDYARAYEALGELYLYKKENEQAAAALEKAVQLRPNFAKAHDQLGRAYQALGRSAEAQQEFARARSPN